MWKTSDGLLFYSELKAEEHENWLQEQFPDINCPIARIDSKRLRNNLSKLHDTNPDILNEVLDDILDIFREYHIGGGFDSVGRQADLLNTWDNIILIISSLRKVRK